MNAGKTRVHALINMCYPAAVLVKFSMLQEEHCSPKVKTAKDSKDEDLRQVFRQTIFSDPIGQPSTSKIIKQPSTSKIIVQPGTERSMQVNLNL